MRLVGTQSLDISIKTSFFMGESNALMMDTKSIESFITFVRIMNHHLFI
jgi:hypothetical protein